METMDEKLRYDNVCNVRIGQKLYDNRVWIVLENKLPHAHLEFLRSLEPHKLRLAFI